MGRITRGANRGINKTLGSNAGGFKGFVLKWSLVAGLVLGVLSALGGEAQAATGKEPTARVKCNTYIEWDINTTSAPAGVDTRGTVKWAYDQVADLANIQHSRGDSEDVVWAWQSATDGGTYRPGKTYRYEGGLGLNKWWEHGLDADRAWTPDAFREHVLRGVLTDFGVESPEATGAGLTADDRAALARACDRQAKAQDDDSDDGGLLTGLNPGGGVPTAGVLGGLSTLDLLVLLFLVGPLVVFLLAGERLAQRFGSKDTDGEPDPA